MPCKAETVLNGGRQQVKGEGQQHGSSCYATNLECAGSKLRDHNTSLPFPIWIQALNPGFLVGVLLTKERLH